MAINLQVKIGSLKLASPVICASGTFGFGEEMREFASFRDIGAFVTKTITPQPRPGNPAPRIFEVPCGVLNSVGLENPGLEGFIKEKIPLIKKLKSQAIISVGGFSFQDYEEIIRCLDKERSIKAFEINLSCPNIKAKKIISQDHVLTRKLTQKLRRVTGKILVIKITPESNDVAKIAMAAQDAGADAISLVNTFFGMAVNTGTLRPVLGSIYGGYSGRGIKPMAVYKVWKAACAVKIPVIGGGGIESANDAIEFILAGASAISVGTQNLVYPSCAGDITLGIKDYMRKHKIYDINELKGKLETEACL